MPVDFDQACSLLCWSLELSSKESYDWLVVKFMCWASLSSCYRRIIVSVLLKGWGYCKNLINWLWMIQTRFSRKSDASKLLLSRFDFTQNMWMIVGVFFLCLQLCFSFSINITLEISDIVTWQEVWTEFVISWLNVCF